MNLNLAKSVAAVGMAYLQSLSGFYLKQRLTAFSLFPTIFFFSVMFFIPPLLMDLGHIVFALSLCLLFRLFVFSVVSKKT